MSNLVIVAIPKENDYVWKISSEKVPHMTLLFLGDAASNPNVVKIGEFLEHAVKLQKRGPFMMDVDHRGELGEDKADVLFFRKNWDYDQISAFRSQLLQYTPIKTAYDSVPQYPEWTPHLTLGYPGTPARKDERDYPGINWVDFDRIAMWFGDYQGPEFRLEYSYDLAEVAMGQTNDVGAAAVEQLLHFGVKGMKWGVRKERKGPYFGVARRDERTKATIEAKTAIDAERAKKLPVSPVQTYTTVGANRFSKTQIQTHGGENHPATKDAIKVAETKQKLKKSGVNALSNAELKELTQRLELETKVEKLNGKQTSIGQMLVSNLLESQGGNRR